MENRQTARQELERARILLWSVPSADKTREAAVLLQAAIVAGSTDAYYELGRCHMETALAYAGADRKEGVRLYECGAALGNAFCVLALGRLGRSTGEGVLSYDEAFAVVMEYALNGDAAAAYVIAMCYAYGDVAAFLLKNSPLLYDEKRRLWRREAVRWFERCPEIAMTLSPDTFGAAYLELGGTHAETGIALLRHRMEDGNARCALCLGEILCDGLYGRERNVKEALRCLQIADSLGENAACARIGEIYSEGPDDLRNPAQAVRYLERALETLRDPDGMLAFRLGCLYEVGGKGLAADVGKALAWFQRALRCGCHKAWTHVGAIYLRTGASKDGELGRLCLYKGMRNGDAAAAILVGDYYCDESMPFYVTDEDLAKESYYLAGCLGEHTAWRKLAALYLKKYKKPRCVARALHYLRKAADRGDAVAYLELARIYRFGTGVARDKEMSQIYLKQAEAMGVQEPAAPAAQTETEEAKAEEEGGSKVVRFIGQFFIRAAIFYFLYWLVGVLK